MKILDNFVQQTNSMILWITGITLAIAIIPDLNELLQYDRTTIFNGELWRIITCHFTHCSQSHLFWDLLAFILIYSLCKRWKVIHIDLCIVLSIVLIPLTIWVLKPELIYYRGLSGIDSALYVLLMLNLVHRSMKIDDHGATLCITFCIIGFIGKILYELTSNQTLFVKASIESNMITVPLAHITGAFIGVGIWVYCHQIQSWVHHFTHQTVQENFAT